MARLSAAPIETDSYERFVRDCAHVLGKASQPIYNKNAVHSTILIKYLIARANREIRILSGWLDREIFADADLISAMTLFLRKPGTSVRVLVDWRPPKAGVPVPEIGELFHTNEFVRSIKASLAHPDQLAVRSVPSDVAEKYGYHLIVADLDCFRFEEDRNFIDAVGQFGNVELATKLAVRFDEIWDLSSR